MASELPVLNAPLHRHLSFSEAPASPPSPHAVTLCNRIRGRRRCWTLAECEFDELTRNCVSIFSCWASPTQKRHDGGIDGAIEEDEFYEDDLANRTPSRFKTFCRKVRAEARNVYRQNTPVMMGGASRFHYDALSYAMNFDDSAWMHKQDDLANNIHMRLHSARFSGSISPLTPPISSEP